MINRKLGIMIALLVAGAAVVLVVDHQEQKASRHADSRVGQPLLASAALAGVDQVEIKKTAGTATLVRDGEGVWHLGGSAGFPVDASKVLKLLDDLGRTAYQMVAGTGQEHMGEFGLTAPTSVTLKEKGQERLALNLGDNRKGGGQFAATGGEYKVYLINPPVSVSADADAWEMKTLVNLDKDLIKAVAYAPAPGLNKQPVTLAREKKEDPLKVQALPATEKESPMVRGAEGQFANLSYTKRYDPSNEQAKAAMAAPSQVTATLFDGRVYTFKVGSVGDKTKTYFLQIHGEAGPNTDDKGKKAVQAVNALMTAQAFSVPEWVAQHFERGLADFTEAHGKG